jgi:hypothetical protein
VVCLLEIAIGQPAMAIFSIRRTQAKVVLLVLTGTTLS